jgi:sodium transport system permease protein
MMPLMMLPMAPGVELTLGNSLIPVTGVVLLLRNMLEGNYLQAAPFIAPVALMTLVCCLLAARWATDQFSAESVLFRESERLDFGLWLRHLLRDREDTPSAPAAVFCGVLILTLNFFMSFALRDKAAAQNPVVLSLITQLVVIGTPALLMTVMLTRSPRKTLLLRLPPLGSVMGAVVLAVAVHPIVNALNVIVQQLYPVNESLEQLLHELVKQAPSRAHLLLAIAVAPAIFEELAFRGFILSGFRHLGHKWRAIALSSFFFGVAHGVFQQSLVASIVGMLIGYLAIQTGSLLPGVAYHFVHNSLALLTVELTGAWRDKVPALRWIVSDGETGFAFTWPAMLLGTAVAILALAWFHALPYRRSDEEVLQDAIDHQVIRAV